MLREIVLDTETTGVDALKGDRIVEIGCVELLNHIPTGRHYHVYINPQRPVSRGAFEVHGLSDEFLADKPTFEEIAQEFYAFIADAKLVIHNAAFDIGFIDMELSRVGLPRVPPENVIDTLSMARHKHPGASNTLDALCARYGIDNSRRTKHGALLDAEILAEVYIELIGGKQADLGFGVTETVPTLAVSTQAASRRVGEALQRPVALPPAITDAERAAHAAFIAEFGENALWREYIRPDAE